MKQIILKKLELKNFKGIKDLSIDFSKVTNIFGENASGKTTIFDSFMWLLFDKDSQDRSKFQIQPLDSNNNVIHKVDTEITAVLLIDGIQTTFRKVLREKWVKKRGEAESNLTGTETNYYIDEAPYKMGEYKNYISGLIQEAVFKLLTNPWQFGNQLSWQERRKILFELNGNMDQADVINYNSKLSVLNDLLNLGEDMETFTKRIKAQISKLKKDKEGIAPRIDEQNSSLKTDIDFKELELEKQSIQSEISDIEVQLTDVTKSNDALLAEQNKLYQLKSKLTNLEYKLQSEAKKPLYDLKQKFEAEATKISSLKYKISTLQNEVEQTNKLIEQKKAAKNELVTKWYTENDKKLVFDENNFICPTCHRAFEDADIEAKKEEIQGNFHETKAKKLANINAAGQKLKTEIEELEAKVNSIDIASYQEQLKASQEEAQKLQEQINSFVPNTDLCSAEYSELNKQITDLETKLQQPAGNNLKELQDRRATLQKQLSDIQIKLNYRERNAEITTRIAELRQQDKDLAQQIADLEKAEFLTEEFIKTKVELLESKINSKFKFVKFKLFETQVNGGVNEACEALVGGVPFSNANTASQINAGLDIINTLSDFYGVEAPIFIDNRESINQIIDCNSQIINLVVSKDKNLRVEGEE